MKFITCGTTWGEHGFDFYDISLKLNIAILGNGNKNLNTFRKLQKDDYIALKQGHQIYAIGRFITLEKERKWNDIDRVISSIKCDYDKEYFLSDIVSLDESIDCAKVEEWIILNEPIYYPMPASTVQIQEKTYYQQCRNIIIKKQEEQAMQEYIQLLEQQKNIVLTGAPGTGKTYLAQDIAKEMTKIEDTEPTPLAYIKYYYESNKEELDKEDIKMEQLRQRFLELFPLDDVENMTLDDYCMGDKSNYPNNFSRWVEFFLKPVGYMGSGAANIHIVYKKGEDEYNVDNYEEIFPKILKGVKEIATTGRYIGELPFKSNWIMKVANSYDNKKYFPVYTRQYLNNICEIFNIEKSKDVYQTNKNILEYFNEQLPEITSWQVMTIFDRLFVKDGKDSIEINMTTVTDINHIEFVQFHPSFDYTDFVEGLRPIQKDNGELGFELKNGIFKEFCVKATRFPNEKFVFIIDEINRAEISKVFGELFFSIDPSYRGKEGKVQLQYENLYDKDGTDPFRDGFYVPENVYIIATMNDIDRSIEPFDFAMKRRFAWCEIKPTDTCDSMWEGVDWKNEAKNRMLHLNVLISKELSPAYEIGGAYFLKLNDLKGDFEKLWEYHIEPVIKDYLRGHRNIEEELARFKKAYKLEEDIESNDNESN